MGVTLFWLLSWRELLAAGFLLFRSGPEVKFSPTEVCYAFSRKHLRAVGSESARVHHTHRRRGGGRVAARAARAAAGDAGLVPHTKNAKRRPVLTLPSQDHLARFFLRGLQ